MSVDAMLDGEPLPTAGTQVARWVLAGALAASAGWAAGGFAVLAWAANRLGCPVRIRIR